jgi:hypothetical protein
MPSKRAFGAACCCQLSGKCRVLHRDHEARSERERREGDGRGGKHVVFLDNDAAFSQNPNYRTALMADNLHPNDAGYVVLGQSFYGVIGELLRAAP